MHTANTETVNRTSLAKSLVDRYNEAPSLPSGGGDAKKVGLPTLATTDYVGQGDGEFRAQQYPSGIANDTRSVQVSMWNSHGGAGVLKTEKYAPGGRRP